MTTPQQHYWYNGRPVRPHPGLPHWHVVDPGPAGNDAALHIALFDAADGQVRAEVHWLRRDRDIAVAELWRRGSPETRLWRREYPPGAPGWHPYRDVLGQVTRVTGRSLPPDLRKHVARVEAEETPAPPAQKAGYVGSRISGALPAGAEAERVPGRDERAAPVLTGGLDYSRSPVTRPAARGGGQAAGALPHAEEPQNGPLQLVVTDYEGRTGDRDHITRSEKGLIPTAAIAHLKGVNGEMPGDHRNRRGQKWQDFKDDIRTNGIKNPVFITVDYGAEPQISEGSQLRDAAVELRLPQVPVEIRYFGHAEREGSVYERMPETGGPELANHRAARPAASRYPKATGSGIASPGGHAHPGKMR